MKPLPEHWFHILLALADRSRHGLGVIEEINERTAGDVQVWPGMLYVALKRMMDAQLIQETDAPAGFAVGGGRPRFYKITTLGRKTCSTEAQRLARIVHSAQAKRILKNSF